MSNTQPTTTVDLKQQPMPAKPNETGTINVQGYFRVFDPNTQKTIVEGRA
jgi:hypothetical protein